MSAGLAALMGILKGAEGFPEGMITAEKQRLAEQTLADATRHRQDTLAETQRHNQVVEGQAYVDLDESAAGAIGLPAGRHRADTLPIFEKIYEKKLATETENARRAKLGSAIDSISRDEAPTTRVHDYSEAAMYSPEQPEPVTIETPGKQLAMPEKLRRIIAAGATKDEIAAFQPKLEEVSAGAGLWDPVSRKLVHSQPAAPPVQRDAAYERLARNGLAAEYQLGHFPYAPGSPEFEMELAYRTEQTTTTAPGGETFRKRNLPRPPGAWTPPNPDPIGGASNVTPGASVSRPSNPAASTVRDIAELNSLLTLGKGLVAQWDKNPNAKAGVLGRLGERELMLGIRPSDVIGPTRTPEQRTFEAGVTDIIAAYRAVRSGLTVTNSEALRTMPFVPDEPGAVLPEQLKALVAWAERNRVEIDRALRAANQRPGPAPQAPAGAAPAAPTVWTLRDNKTGRERKYQPDPGETQPPAGYTRVR